jgi:hypothetical protein
MKKLFALLLLVLALPAAAQFRYVTVLATPGTNTVLTNYAATNYSVGAAVDVGGSTLVDLQAVFRHTSGTATNGLTCWVDQTIDYVWWTNRFEWHIPANGTNWVFATNAVSVRHAAAVRVGFTNTAAAVLTNFSFKLGRKNGL